VASRLGKETEGELQSLVSTGLVLLLALGVTGGVVLALLDSWIVAHLKDIPATLRGEALSSIYWLALSLPFVVLTAGLRGIIEAHGHWVASSILRLPLAFFSYIAPLAVLPFTRRLDVVVAVLVAGRAVTAVLHVVICLRRYWYLQRRFAFHFRSIRPLLRIGGWMTVSNVVSPLMTYVDRFFISAMLPIAAVAYYATPYEAVSKLLIFPTAVVAVLFPAFANADVGENRRAATMLHDGMRAVAVCLFPVVFVLAALPTEILTLWIRNADLAQHGGPVLRWLAIGVFANSLAYVPFVALQGIGRPDITGKVNLAELPLYAAALFLLAREMGINGVAIAWTLRVAADAVFLYLSAHRLTKRGNAERVQLGLPIGMLAAFAACFAIDTTRGRLVLALVVLGAFLPYAWLHLIRPEEKAAVLGFRSRLAR
jgi:O-antigen/teichoic acid export membrane protein